MVAMARNPPTVRTQYQSSDGMKRRCISGHLGKYNRTSRRTTREVNVGFRPMRCFIVRARAWAAYCTTKETSSVARALYTKIQSRQLYPGTHARNENAAHELAISIDARLPQHARRLSLSRESAGHLHRSRQGVACC